MINDGLINHIIEITILLVHEWYNYFHNVNDMFIHHI